jgi:cobalt-zinc-cadmium efflux system protein
MHTHHHAEHEQSEGLHRRLLWSLALTLGFSLVEAIGGYWSGSLALLGDAGHMLTDSLALGLAAGAAVLARRAPSSRHSYGLGRSEILAALFNALLMILLVAAISAEAVERLTEAPAVKGGAVMIVALIGLLINIAVAGLLSHGHANLNVRAALWHVLGDLLGSVAALVSGVVIMLTGWTPIDPMLSLLIVALILFSALRILREALHALMEGVPLHLNLERVGYAMAAVDGVVSVHDQHIWSLSASRTALSAHVVVRNLDQWAGLLEHLRATLARDFGIEHVTLQPEVQEQRVAVDSLIQRTAGHRDALRR